MVSEWMENGNLNQFVKAHWDANRFKLVRFPYGPVLVFHCNLRNLRNLRSLGMLRGA